MHVRAAAASAFLATLGDEGSTILVITHGVFRRILAQQLLAEGWRALPRSDGFNHWSFWTFERTDERRGTTSATASTD